MLVAIATCGLSRGLVSSECQARLSHASPAHRKTAAQQRPCVRLLLLALRVVAAEASRFEVAGGLDRSISGNGGVSDTQREVNCARCSGYPCLFHLYLRSHLEYTEEGETRRGETNTQTMAEWVRFSGPRLSSMDSTHSSHPHGRSDSGGDWRPLAFEACGGDGCRRPCASQKRCGSEGPEHRNHQDSPCPPQLTWSTASSKGSRGTQPGIATGSPQRRCDGVDSPRHIALTSHRRLDPRWTFQWSSSCVTSGHTDFRMSSRYLLGHLKATPFGRQHRRAPGIESWVRSC